MDDIDENFLERHGLVRTHRGNRRRRARTIANRVNRTRNVDNNREYLFNMRDRLFQAIFQRATMTYAKTIPKTMRRTIEIFLLLKALLAFFSLIYIHFQFSKNSAITLNSVVKNWPETGILRLELSDDLSYVQETDSDLKLSDLCMKVFQTKKNPSKIRSRYTLNPHGLKTTCFRNNTNNVLQNMTNIINELLLENLKSEHIVEYSIEQGLLRLSDELRKKFNVPVLRVVINASNDDCFGSTVSRVLIEEYLGYDDFLTSVLKNVARSHGSNGYIKNANTDEYFMINKMWRGTFSYVVALMLMLFFTAVISILLRFIQHQLFVILVDVLHVLEYNTPITIPFSIMISAILALLGMELILYDFFKNSTLSFFVIVVIWIADQFDNICCNTTVSKRYWVRFFYMYHFLFYAYHYKFHGQYNNLAYSASWLFIEHSMVYFFHHYEIPAVEHETRRRHQSRLYMEQQVERARNVIASANEVVRMEMENRVVETQSVGTETDPDGEIVGNYTLLLTVERYDNDAESSLGEEIPELVLTQESSQTT